MDSPIGVGLSLAVIRRTAMPKSVSPAEILEAIKTVTPPRFRASG
jgi:hypothetical protein